MDDWEIGGIRSKTSQVCLTGFAFPLFEQIL